MDYLPNIIKVKALEDFKLLCEFSNGEKRIYDFKKIISRGGVFKKLSNPAIFKRAFIISGAVCWNDDLDFDPCEIYYYGEKI
mgnify:CR=1 FL=1